MPIASSVAYKNTSKDGYSSLLDMIYPVGSIYWSFNSTSPATLFGGTWVQIINTFIRAENSSGLTGGSNNVTLTTNQMPKHTHTGPSHTHTISGTAASAGSHNHQPDKGATTGFRCYPRNSYGTELWGTNSYQNTKNQAHSWIISCATTTSNGAHTHTVSGTAAVSGTGATGSSGNGEAFNNMPHYTTAYCWRRTA